MERINQYMLCLRNLLGFFQSDAAFQNFSTSVYSVFIINDASPMGIGEVFDQEDRPVICVPGKLTDAEQGCAQNQREALAVFWTVK